jgi:hypothetical protein
VVNQKPAQIGYTAGVVCKGGFRSELSKMGFVLYLQFKRRYLTWEIH